MIQPGKFSSEEADPLAFVGKKLPKRGTSWLRWILFTQEGTTSGDSVSQWVARVKAGAIFRIPFSGAMCLLSGCCHIWAQAPAWAAFESSHFLHDSGALLLFHALNFSSYEEKARCLPL